MSYPFPIFAGGCDALVETKVWTSTVLGGDFTNQGTGSLLNLDANGISGLCFVACPTGCQANEPVMSFVDLVGTPASTDCQKIEVNTWILASDGGSPDIDFVIELFDGTTEIASKLFHNPSGSATKVTVPVNDTEFNNITDFNDLTVKFDVDICGDVFSQVAALKIEIALLAK